MPRLRGLHDAAGHHQVGQARDVQRITRPEHQIGHAAGGEDTEALARETFRFSIWHLSLLFAALLIDHYLRPWL